MKPAPCIVASSCDVPRHPKKNGPRRSERDIGGQQKALFVLHDMPRCVVRGERGSLPCAFK